MEVFGYPTIRTGIEVALLRYHSGLLDTCMGMVKASPVFHAELIVDLPVILSRVCWPSLGLYAEFHDDGDFSVLAIQGFLENLLNMQRNMDVIGLHQIFWHGTGRTDLPQHLRDSVLYLNAEGLATNMTTDSFTGAKIETLENSLINGNPQGRVLSEFESHAIRVLCKRIRQGGKWHHLFQLILAAMLISLQGVTRKALLTQVSSKVTLVTTPVRLLPTLLHLEDSRGLKLRSMLEARTKDATVIAAIVKVWEEYELCKKHPEYVVSNPLFSSPWFDYAESLIPANVCKKWDEEYHPLLRSLVATALGKTPHIPAATPPPPKPVEVKKVVRRRAVVNKGKV